MKILFDDEIGKKISNLSKDDEKLLLEVINLCFEYDVTPNLPSHLLELYQELRKYNLAHNDELKKRIEAQHKLNNSNEAQPIHQEEIKENPNMNTLKTIIINPEWMKKYNQLHYTKRRLLDASLKYVGTDIKPNLPAPLLDIYEELNTYNLAHNDELKKRIEAQHEKK